MDIRGDNKLREQRTWRGNAGEGVRGGWSQETESRSVGWEDCNGQRTASARGSGFIVHRCHEGANALK